MIFGIIEISSKSGENMIYLGAKVLRNKSLKVGWQLD